MLFREAIAMARQGRSITRPAFGDSFVVVRDGRILKGSFIGGTGLARMVGYAFAEDDLLAADWVVFRRVLPDDWIGCDAG